MGNLENHIQELDETEVGEIQGGSMLAAFAFIGRVFTWSLTL
jgi:hypothetical protein